MPLGDIALDSSIRTSSDDCKHKLVRNYCFLADVSCSAIWIQLDDLAIVMSFKFVSCLAQEFVFQKSASLNIISASGKSGSFFGQSQTGFTNRCIFGGQFTAPPVDSLLNRCQPRLPILRANQGQSFPRSQFACLWGNRPTDAGDWWKSGESFG